MLERNVDGRSERPRSGSPSLRPARSISRGFRPKRGDSVARVAFARDSDSLRRPACGPSVLESAVLANHRGVGLKEAGPLRERAAVLERSRGFRGSYDGSSPARTNTRDRHSLPSRFAHVVRSSLAQCRRPPSLTFGQSTARAIAARRGQTTVIHSPPESNGVREARNESQSSSRAFAVFRLDTRRCGSSRRDRHQPSRPQTSASGSEVVERHRANHVLVSSYGNRSATAA